MEIPKIGTGFKALMVAGVLQDEGAMGAATAVLAAGIGKKIFGGLFKKKQEDTLERKFEKVLDERKRLFEKNLPESSILGKTKLVLKKIKEGLSKFLTAVLAALKTIFTIIKTALITVAKALLALVKWIGKKLLRGLLKSLMKLCKSGGFRKMKARIKVFGRKLKRFIKSPAALLIGGIALGIAGYFSAIFKKEKKEIDEIGGEDDEKDTSVSEEAPAKTEEATPPAVAPEAAPAAPPDPIPGQVRVESGGGLTTSEGTPVMTGEPVPAQAAPAPRAGIPVPAPAAPAPRAAGTPVPAPAAPAPRAAGTPVPAPAAPAPRAAGTPVPAPQAAPPRAAGTPVPAARAAPDSGGAQGPLAANIAAYESKGGYNAYNRGTRGNTTTGAVMGGSRNDVYMDIMTKKPMDFSEMTIEEFLKRSNMSLPYTIFTVGKYQVIPSTMIEAVAHMKLNPKTTYLTSDIQEMIYSQYLVGAKRPNVKKYISGQSDDINAAVLDLAMEFASVQMPYDTTIKGRRLTKGKSFYDGIGGNVAHNPLQDTIAALQSQRKINLAKMEGGTREASAPAPASGKVLASAGQTQYDEDKNSKTNVVIIPKANNKTNNIEESRKAA